MNGHVSFAEFNRAAVVLSSIGARCGKCFFVQGQWTSLANTQVILPNLERCDPRFLWYQLNNEARWPRSGTGQPFIKPSDVKRNVVWMPPIEEQRRIAAILDKADDLRAKRQAALAHLGSLTQSIFLDMFGDTEVNHYGWPTAPLSSLVRPGDHIGYGVIQPGSDVEHGVPLIRVGDLADGRVGRSQLKRIDPAIEEKYPRSRLRGDEVLLSCVGSIGIVALASPADRGCNIARAIARVPLRPDVSQIFGAAVLSTGRAQRHFAAEVRTSSQPTLNIKQIGETPVILPPSELRQRFDRRVKEVDARLSDARVHAAALATLMSSLQHRAFSGAL